MTRSWLLCLTVFLFGLFPILFFYTNNAQRIPPVETVRPVVVVLVLDTLLLLGAFAVLKNLIRASLACSVFQLVVFCYGHLLFWLTERNVAQWIDVLLRNSVVAAAFIVSIVWLTLRFTRQEQTALKVMNGMCVTGIFLITINLISLFNLRGVLWKPKVPSTSPFPAPSTVTLRPDIYYIVLDGYPRWDVLKSAYGYDNSHFMQFLRENQFVIADRSRSNYCHTLFSLSSSLNGDFVQNLEPGWQQQPNDLLPLGELISHSRAVAFLKSLGYQTISLPSGVALTEMRDADLVVSSRWCLNQFEYGWLITSPVGQTRRLCNFLTQAHRRRVLDAFEELPEVAGLSGPKFVFAHILCPHSPFVFQRDGSVPPDTARFSEQPHFFNWTRLSQERFREQVEFVTAKVQRTLASILARSKQPPIVIVQSDHGNGPHWVGASASPLGLRERTAILNAYRVDEAHRGEIYADVSSVNTFRLLFNSYFGSKLSLMPDRVFFSPAVEPQKFVDVTEQVNEGDLLSENYLH